MVAISMYRGNLHKVPDVPRRWQMPERKLSVKDFKSLLHRRRRALARLLPKSNPNPKLHSVPEEKPAKLAEAPGSSAELKPFELKTEEISADQVWEDDVRRVECGGAGRGGSDGGNCSGKEGEVQPKKEADVVAREDGNSPVVEKPADAANEKAEILSSKLVKETADEPNEREKRMKEVEEKLQVLSAKKHNLVQVLKQILNAEEELKRRNNIQQGIAAARPALPLQVDVSNDSGANTGGHIEGGETEDAVNLNVQSRNLLRMSSASPSSESPLRKAAFTQHNMVPHPSRASPRFVATGHQAQPGNNPPPTVSISASGTNYFASSPSPAASGGTSVFRDSRLQSPWN